MLVGQYGWLEGAGAGEHTMTKEREWDGWGAGRLGLLGHGLGLVSLFVSLLAVGSVSL